MTGLIYSGIYEGKGSGHVIRMKSFIELTTSRYNWHLDFQSNNNTLSRRILNKIGSRIDIGIVPLKDHYDFIVLDSPNDEIELVGKLRNKTNLLIRLDSINYNHNVDLIINIFNHNFLALKQYEYKLFHGLKYSIIKQDVLEAKRKEGKKPKCLITFGGEDPRSNSKVVFNLLKNKELESTLILGPLNADKEYLSNQETNNIQIIPPTNRMGELMASHDIIICGGGTTLLEAIYLGNPIIVLPQNEAEINFIKHIRSFIKLFDITDLGFLMEHIVHHDFRKNIKETYKELIDGKGYARIVEVIKAHV